MRQTPSRNSYRAVRDLHERHMAGGQNCLFLLEDGRLVVRAEQRHWLGTHRRKALRMLSLKSTDRFVDLGCGEGYLTLSLAQRAGWSIGMDFAATSFQVLKAQPDYDARRLKLLIGPGDNIPLLQLEKAKAGHLVPELIGQQGHIRFYSLRSVVHLLDRDGFRVIQAEGIGLSLKDRLDELFRRNGLLFGLSTAAGRLFPSMGTGVLVLAERRPR